MIKKFGYVIAAVGLLSGCAWKGKEAIAPTPNPVTKTSEKVEGGSTEQTKAAVLQDMALSIEWPSSVEGKPAQKINRTLSEKKDLSKDFYLDAPVTLSAMVPDEIGLDLQVGKLNPHLDETIVLSIKADSSDLTLKENSVVVSSDHLLVELVNEEPHLVFKIQGLRNALSDKDQQKLYVTVDLRYSKSNLKFATIYLTLITPPKRIYLEQKAVSEINRGPGIESLNIMELQSPAKKLELIQVVKAQNKSGENVTVDVPVRISGKLWQKRRYFKPQPNFRPDPKFKVAIFYDSDLCLDTLEESNMDKTFSENFYLLPLTEDLKKDWISNLTKNSATLAIPAGKDRLFGIFAENNNPNLGINEEISNSKLSEYYKHAYHGTKVINTKCEFGCIHPNYDHGRYLLQCDALSKTHLDWLELCKEKISTCKPCIDQGNINTKIVWGSSCNKCFELELLEGINRRLDYHAVKSCNEDWETKVLETKTVPDGYVAENVTLDLNKDEIKAFVRFDFSTKVDDPEGRPFDFLKASTFFE